MSYKTEAFSRRHPNGHIERGVMIIAKNGAEIAECRTQAMADKIVKGLKLYDIEKKKMDSFKL